MPYIVFTFLTQNQFPNPKLNYVFKEKQAMPAYMDLVISLDKVFIKCRPSERD
jgi:hypothetical protein